MSFGPPSSPRFPSGAPGDTTAASAAKLVLRTVRRGAETRAWAQRSVRIDADVYIVVGDVEPPAIEAEAGTRPFAVELPDGVGAAFGGAGFIAATRPVSGGVGRAIAELARERPQAQRVVLAGDAAAALGAALAAEEHALRGRAARILCVKPATRDALFRRLLLSADHIQSHFAEPLNVDVLAAVSNLSPYHFARLFALVMDETPHALLMRKRRAVARRLIGAGLGRGDAAERAGFGCRSTLFRHLREAAAVPR